MEDRTEHASRPEHRIDPELRKRLIKRIAMAGVAIAALLGGLAVIDRYYVPPPIPAPHPLQASLMPPSTKLPEVVPPAAAPVVAPVPETTAEPEQSSSPTIHQPAQPHSTEAPKPAAAPKFVPAKALIVEDDRPSPKVVEEHAAPSKPLARDTGGPKQLVFQMGIFNDVANAERLNEKLKEGGIPSRIEARVQVGPFKTREEAEAARKKLIELGIKPGTLMPVRK